MRFQDKVVIVFDHQVPAPDSKWADLHNVIRQKAKEFGIRLYDIGEHGMMHQIVVQEGHLVPGITAIGTDSHALTGGAVGAVVMGMGATDAVVGMCYPEGLSVRTAGCQGVRAGVRPALAYAEGDELIVGRAKVRIHSFPWFEAILILPTP